MTALIIISALVLLSYIWYVIIRLLSKLAAVSKMREASIAETQVYFLVHADLRSTATSKFAIAVELRKKSIILKRNKVLESLSTVDVQLKQRLDVIPNILTIAQKFMEHEKTLLSDITELRAKAAGAYDKNQPATIRDYLIIDFFRNSLR